MMNAPIARRSLSALAALGAALACSLAPVDARAEEPITGAPPPSAPQESPPPQAQSTPTPQELPPETPAAPAAEAPAPRKPRPWLIGGGALALGGAYAFNALMFPIAAIDPPDGTNAGGNPLLMVVPIIGPFVMGAQTTNNNLGFRRVEYIDGSFQALGAAMIAASFIFPEEKVQLKTASATVQPVVAPRFVGMGGTF